jgi:hypothetical protein
VTSHGHSDAGWNAGLPSLIWHSAQPGRGSHELYASAAPYPQVNSFLLEAELIPGLLNADRRIRSIENFQKPYRYSSPGPQNLWRSASTNCATDTFKTSCRILLGMRSVSDKSCREHQNTRFTSSNLFRKSCHLRDNTKRCCRVRQVVDDNIIRRMRFECWITKATNTHPEYVLLPASPRRQWLRERATMLHYTHTAPLLFLQLFRWHT